MKMVELSITPYVSKPCRQVELIHSDELRLIRLVALALTTSQGGEIPCIEILYTRLGFSPDYKALSNHF